MILFLFTKRGLNDPANITFLKSIRVDCINIKAEKNVNEGQAKGCIACLINPNIYKPSNVIKNKNFIILRIKFDDRHIILSAIYISSLQEIVFFRISLTF